jgi:kumamolisin
MRPRANLSRVLTSAVCAAAALCATIAVAQQVNRSAIGAPIAGGGPTVPRDTGVKPKLMPGVVVVPASSTIVPADLGRKAHTNVMFVEAGAADPNALPPFSGYGFETPSSLACLYSFTTVVSGCNPNNDALPLPTGGSKAVAIVIAFHNPEAAPDLAYYSAQFGLPFSVSKFKVVYASGFEPEIDMSGGWAIESALDTQMVHSLAPNATIYLVEADSNLYSDLFQAVQVATSLVQCGSSTGTCAAVTGAGQVSMSWGGSEWSGQTANDPYFNKTNVVFVASTGDSPGPSYPSTSPNVVAVGGTSVGRSLANGNYLWEVSWSDGGGGRSLVEAEPAYQSSHAPVHAIAAGKRATPDVSADANPYTGVWVYYTGPVDYYYFYDWWTVGGTSLSAPLWAGALNHAATDNNSWAANSQAELTKLYNQLNTTTAYSAAFRDIGSGVCNSYMSSAAAAGYDLCTGLGVPKGSTGK